MFLLSLPRLDLMCDLLTASAVLILRVKYVSDEKRRLDGERTWSSAMTDP